MDFYTIKERSPKKGVVEIYPDFNVCRSKDLMVKGKAFYAIWDEEKGLWSTDEYDVQRLVDKDLAEYRDKMPTYADTVVEVKWMKSWLLSLFGITGTHVRLLFFDILLAALLIPSLYILNKPFCYFVNHILGNPFEFAVIEISLVDRCYLLIWFRHNPVSPLLIRSNRYQPCSHLLRSHNPLFVASNHF